MRTPGAIPFSGFRSITGDLFPTEAQAVCHSFETQLCNAACDSSAGEYPHQRVISYIHSHEGRAMLEHYLRLHPLEDRAGVPL